jgi:outer membrane protein assembly factor BamB
LWNLNRITREKDLIPGDLAGDETLVVVLVYTEGGDRILSVNPLTGLQRWKSGILPSASWLALDDNRVCCAGERLWAFDRRGSNLWEFTPENHVVSNIVVGPDSVYIADAANNLYRIDVDGNLIWKTTWEGFILCTERGSILCCDTYLVGAGDIIYCVG